MTMTDTAGRAGQQDGTTSTYDDLPRLMGLMTGDEKHAPSATSTLDVLWVLYDRVLAVSPATADHPDRDHFLLSKGHGPMAYYAVLAARGFLPEEWLGNWAAFDSPLGMHPDRTLVPGVEISSGSLGHGLPLAVGVALGLRARTPVGTAPRDGGGPSWQSGDDGGLPWQLGDGGGSLRLPRVDVLLGDAEFDEGSNHEAIAYAGRVGLEGLTAVVVDNHSATHGWPGGIAARFAGEGWWTDTVDGRDHDALERALTADTGGRPRAVVALVEAKEGAT